MLLLFFFFFAYTIETLVRIINRKAEGLFNVKIEAVLSQNLSENGKQCKSLRMTKILLKSRNQIRFDHH